MRNDDFTALMRSPAMLIRFWEKIDRRTQDECWPWTASVDSKGYGKFKVSKKVVRSSRIAYAVANGGIPGDLCVLHRCDNPLCCNPGHLFTGTVADNNADRAAKGRTVSGDRRGERNPGCRLSSVQVTEIKQALPFRTNISLGRQYGVGHATISCIRRGITWREAA